MNYDEQIKKLETSFYTFIFEEESNKKLKKNDVEKKAILDSWYFFTERQLAFFSKYDFCYMKQGIPSLLWGFFKSNHIFYIFIYFLTIFAFKNVCLLRCEIWWIFHFIISNHLKYHFCRLSLIFKRQFRSGSFFAVSEWLCVAGFRQIM